MFNYIVIILISSIFFGGFAYADFGIVLSNTIITMHKNNVTNNFPTYEEINVLFPDTSEPHISGGFVTDESGYYHRENKKMHNHFNYYKYHDQSVTWIDPPGDVIEKIPRIIIAANDFEYKIGQQTITNSSYVVGQNRYVSSTCTYIIISGDDWLFLLGDSIQYLLHNCNPEYTNYNEIRKIEWEATKHDITTTAKYQLEKWIEESKRLSKNTVLIPK